MLHGLPAPLVGDQWGSNPLNQVFQPSPIPMTSPLREVQEESAVQCSLSEVIDLKLIIFTSFFPQFQFFHQIKSKTVLSFLKIVYTFWNIPYYQKLKDHKTSSVFVFVKHC